MNKIPINCKYLHYPSFLIYLQLKSPENSVEHNWADQISKFLWELKVVWRFLSYLSLKPLEEFVATFSKDRVLSKIKHPTQKSGNSLEGFLLHHRFLHQVFHSDFLNLWLVALGRKCMAWLRGHMRKNHKRLDSLWPGNWSEWFGASTWSWPGQKRSVRQERDD